MIQSQPLPLLNLNIVIHNSHRFMDVLLAFAVARHWPEVSSNAVSPGWVKTKMGGSSAPGDLKKAIDMPVWLASSDAKETKSGKLYAAQGSKQTHAKANDEATQEKFLNICEQISGVAFPK